MYYVLCWQIYSMKQDEKRPFSYTPTQFQPLSLCIKLPKMIPFKLKQSKKLVKKYEVFYCARPSYPKLFAFFPMMIPACHEKLFH